MAALVLTVLAAGSAWAQTTFEYNLQPRTVRACRLLIPYQDSGGNWITQGGGDLRSLIFEGMRRFPDRPVGWDLDNPFAAGGLVKSQAAYWEVPLDPMPAADSTPLALPTPYVGPQLTNYDLIYIYAGGDDAGGNQVILNLNRAVWRQALMRAVYDGAVVWIDQRRSDVSPFTSAGDGLDVASFAPPGPLEAIRSNDPVEPAALPPFNFVAADQAAGSNRRVYAGTPAEGGDLLRLTRDWLLRYPFKLDEARDVQYVGTLPRQTNVGGGSAAESASPDAITLGGGDRSSYGFHSVIVVNDGANWLSNVAVARYGAGAIVLSAGDVGFDVVNWWRSSLRSRPYSWEAPDSRFAWNVAALASNFGERGGNAAHSGVTAASVPGPLSIGWQFPDRYETIAQRRMGPVVSTPAVGRNMVFAVSLARTAAPTQDPMLIAFDSDPAQDLDGDGRADDGVVDYSAGTSYDMVWSLSLGADWTPRWSSPTVTTLRWGGQNIEAVLVSVVDVTPGNGSYGEVRAYRATDGALLWTRRIAPYDNNAAVLDLSTPTVYRDFACVLASEYWTGADGGNGIEDTYGRAHCFELSYAWTAGDQNGAQWVYPSSDDDPNGDTETDVADPENPKSLPPFQDPYWVAGVAPFAQRPILPPFPTQKPTLSQPEGPLSASGIEVLLHASTPMSFVWNGTEVNLNPAVGGSDYALVPTPHAPATGADLLNPRAYAVLLPQALMTTRTQLSSNIAIRGVEDIDATVTGIWQDPADGRVYAYLRSAEAREYLLPSSANPENWLTLTQSRTPITLNYLVRPDDTTLWTDLTAVPVQGWLKGPVRQVTVHPNPSGRRAAAPTMASGIGYLTWDSIEDEDGNLVRNDWTTASPVGSAVGGIGAGDPLTGQLKWGFDPRSSLPYVGGQQLSKGNLAVGRSNDTVYGALATTANPNAASTWTVRPQVVALNGQPRLQIQLRGGGQDTWLREGVAVQVETIPLAGGAPAVVPASAYQVDSTAKTITFRNDRAGAVDGTIGPLWGKPVWVTYEHSGAAVAITDELHVLPDLLRAQYTPHYIKLNHGMVRVGSIGFSLPNGVPLARPPFAAPYDTMTVNDETPYTAQLTGLAPGASWAPNGFLTRGLLDVRHLRIPGTDQFLRPGSEFIVTYDYAELTLTAPDTYEWLPVTAHERHQLPLNFGVPVGSPVVAGANLHVGTEGYLPTGVRGTAVPGALLQTPDVNSPGHGLNEGPLLGFNGVRKSLLSVLIDPITRLVRGSLAQTALPEASTYGLAGGTDLGTPVTSAAPSVDADGVVVGSRMMRRLSQVSNANDEYQGEGLGFVSRLKPQRTLICDNTRLVEVTGTKPTWICVGSIAAHYHETLNVPGLAEDQKPTPFSRPAKAIYLSNGNMLVADTGNNRVIEIDRQGRQLWPLDVNGYDYYTSTATLNPNLNLERPSDCFRYYVTNVGGVTYTSVNGAMLPGTETHTLIADPGNNRVVDVVTYVNALGVQTHTVNVVTPSKIRVLQPQGMSAVAYTKVQPIFDPSSNAVIGYLCVASNLHQVLVVERPATVDDRIRVNPPAGDTPPWGSAGSNWAWLAWLYDYDFGGPDYRPNDPLIFRNLRDLQFVREWLPWSAYAPQDEEDAPYAYLTVTCGQYGGRASTMRAGQPTHFLSAQGAGVFEFAIRLDAAGRPVRVAATDVAGGVTVTGDDPVWWFNRADYTFWHYNPAAPGDNRRSLTNILYDDAGNADDATPHWLDMAWNPVSAIRLPVDRRPVPYYDPNTGNYVREQRQVRHLITNYAEIIQNLSRDNVADLTAPASLFSSVFVADSDDLNDASPENDLHALDRREVIPDPHEPDWPDPLNQPAYADRR